MKKTILLAGISLFLFSCNSEGTTNSDGTVKASSKKSKDLNCKLLADFKEDYSGLLTKEEISAVYPVDFENVKEKLRSGGSGEYSFSWPSDRPDILMEVVGQKVNITDQNIIGLKTFSYSTSDSDMKSFTETFNMAYKELSEEELERINKNLAKQNKEIESTGKDMMKIRGNRSWEFIEGLGTSSWYKWNEKFGGELAVLAGKAKFYIIIKISDNPKENRDLAVKLAEKVIAKC